MSQDAERGSLPGRPEAEPGHVTHGLGLRVGIVAGLAAGLLAGVFSLFAAEPTLEQAIRMEERRARDRGEAQEQELVTRRQQKVGLVAASAITGAVLGAVLGLVFASSEIGTSPWRRSLWLAGLGWGAFTLLPWLKYPPNPPGVGDPATIDRRQLLYFGLVALGGTLLWGARRLGLALGRRGWREPDRYLAVGSTVVVGAAVLLAFLPANTDHVMLPATLLWRFRLLSLATTTLLWGALGAGFGLGASRTASAKRGLASPPK